MWTVMYMFGGAVAFYDTISSRGNTVCAIKHN